MDVKGNVKRESPDASDLLVACFCADWRGICREYRAGFDSLSAAFPDVNFIWIDIEDEADWAGEFEVDDFPCFIIQKAASILFFGSMPPQHALLVRQSEVWLWWQNGRGASARKVISLNGLSRKVN